MSVNSKDLKKSEKKKFVQQKKIQKLIKEEWKKDVFLWVLGLKCSISSAFLQTVKKNAKSQINVSITSNSLLHQVHTWQEKNRDILKGADSCVAAWMVEAYLKQHAGWRRACSWAWWVGALVRRRRRRRMEGVQETQRGGVLHQAGLELDSWASEVAVGWSNWTEGETIRGLNNLSDPNKAQPHNNLIKHSSTQWFRCAKWVKSITIPGKKINKESFINTLVYEVACF